MAEKFDRYEEHIYYDCSTRIAGNFKYPGQEYNLATECLIGSIYKDYSISYTLYYDMGDHRLHRKISTYNSYYFNQQILKQ